VSRGWVSLYAADLVWSGSDIAVNQADQILEPIEGFVVAAVVREVFSNRLSNDVEDVVVERGEFPVATREQLPLKISIQQSLRRKRLGDGLLRSVLIGPNSQRQKLLKQAIVTVANRSDSHGVQRE
jgi:hypothetical protein